MDVLVDTNLLIRRISPADGQHRLAARALRQLATNGDSPVIAIQNLVEFWVVCTRPRSANGLGIAPDRLGKQLVRLDRFFRLLPEREDVPVIWRRLVADHQVIGKSAHDARLVATMMSHGISRILTFNIDHFRRFPGIVPVHPSALDPVA